jgi:Ca2+-binding EF-hand superfamily protein
MFRIVRNAALVALPMAVISICALAQAADPPTPGGHENFAQRAIQKMDTSGDGRVSLDEYLAAATTRFKSLDSQNKGSIDAADLASSKTAIMRIDHRSNALVRRLDTAGNGYVTQDEFVAAAQKRFARLDKNGDGKLTPDELRARGQRGADTSAGAAAGKWAQAVQNRFAAADTNHDGVVTLDEYVAAAKAHYAKLDLQHNGKVTASEIAASPATQERALHVANRFVEHMDTNGDGVVSQDEFLAAAKARFAKIDKNGDGFIDADEMAGQRWPGKGHGHPG